MTEEIGISIDGVLAVVGEQAKQLAVLNGKFVTLQKHCDKQAAELAELRKKKDAPAAE
jgi:predicted HicB family RNase H-like nuclease